MPSARSIVYVTWLTLLWVVALPAALIADAAGGWFPARSPILVVLAVAVVVVGVWLIARSADQLVAGGVSLLGVAPGPRLVVDGVYGQIRNPIDVGTVLLSLAPWIAMRVELMWIIPAGTLVWLVGGIGPYEDRRLSETFGNEFDAYRHRVRRWVPLRASDAK
jgi:protein-S-isoprenylcysteine O-methyltransferase Ste14